MFLQAEHTFLHLHPAQFSLSLCPPSSILRWLESVPLLRHLPPPPPAPPLPAEAEAKASFLPVGGVEASCDGGQGFVPLPSLLPLSSLLVVSGVPGAPSREEPEPLGHQGAPSGPQQQPVLLLPLCSSTPVPLPPLLPGDTHGSLSPLGGLGALGGQSGGGDGPGDGEEEAEGEECERGGDQVATRTHLKVRKS